MTWEVERRVTTRCSGLRIGRWPAVGGTRSLCLFLPGLGDFLEKRAPVAGQLAADGHDVLSLDWCGQGGSGRLSADAGAVHADDFDHYVEDLREVLARQVAPSRPTWLLGYSMGATVGLLALRRRVLAPAAVVLVSPMLRLPLPVPEWLARLAAEAAQALGRGQSFAPGEGARTEVMGAMPSEAADEACRLRVRALAEAHSDLAVRGTTWGWSRAALAAMPRARKASWAGGPALVVTATGERSVDLSPVPALCHRLGARHLALAGGHDLFLSAPEAREQLHAAIAATVGPTLAIRGVGR